MISLLAHIKETKHSAGGFILPFVLSDLLLLSLKSNLGCMSNAFGLHLGGNKINFRFHSSGYEKESYPPNAGSLPLTETIVSMWSLCAWTMNVNLPPWIAPQLTICQRGTKSDVPPIMKAVLGNPAAESPPCRRLPHTLFLKWLTALLNPKTMTKSIHDDTEAKDKIPVDLKETTRMCSLNVKM